jgi:capsular polysaccharide export protein
MLHLKRTFKAGSRTMEGGGSMILFFAASREQFGYFTKLKEHMALDASVVRSKTLLLPSLQGLFALLRFRPQAIVDLKIREKHQKRALSAWGRLLYRVQLYVEVYWAFPRYFRALSSGNVTLLAVWNGHKLPQAVAIKAAEVLGVDVVYFENGLFPNTTTVDFRGINYCNSIPRERSFFEDLTFDTEVELPNRLVAREANNREKFVCGDLELPERYIFVPFQVDHDTQIILHSRWIANMEQLFETVQALPRHIHFVLKEHPSALRDYSYLHDRTHENVMFANSVETQTLIENAEAVMTINSTVGIEGLLFHKRVIVLGNAFYAIDGICKKAESTDELSAIINHLESWKLDVRLIGRLLRYIQSVYAIPGSKNNPDDVHYRKVEERLRQKISGNIGDSADEPVHC